MTVLIDSLVFVLSSLKGHPFHSQEEEEGVNQAEGTASVLRARRRSFSGLRRNLSTKE